MNKNTTPDVSVSAKNVLIADIEQNSIIKTTEDEKIDAAAARILTQYRRAFEELAK